MNFEIFNVFITNGASINIIDINRNTALHYAVANNNIRVAKYLISKFVNINSQNKDGDTALHLAVYLGFSEIAEILLKSGAYISPNKKGATPFHLSINRNEKCLDLLMKYHAIHVNSRDNEGNTALHIACLQNNYNCISILIENGAVLSRNKFNLLPYELTQNPQVKTTIDNYYEFLKRTKIYKKTQGKFYLYRDGVYDHWKTYPIFYFSCL